MPERITGCCAVCDKPLYEVLEIHTDGPYQGEPRRLGPAHSRVRLHLLLVDGKLMVVSVCPECNGDIDLISLWKRLWAAHVRERKAWRLHKAEPFAPEQTAQAYADSAKLWNNVPMGVLYRET